MFGISDAGSSIGTIRILKLVSSDVILAEETRSHEEKLFQLEIGSSLSRDINIESTEIITFFVCVLILPLRRQGTGLAEYIRARIAPIGTRFPCCCPSETR
jgi:hypothetical protein